MDVAALSQGRSTFYIFFTFVFDQVILANIFTFLTILFLRKG